MTSYKLEYTGKACFLKWSQYWISMNMKIRYSKWKSIYPSIVKMEVSTPEAIKKYGPKWKINDPYFVEYEDGYRDFIDNKTEVNRFGAGKWLALPRNSIEDMFE